MSKAKYTFSGIYQFVLFLMTTAFFHHVRRELKAMAKRL